MDPMTTCPNCRSTLKRCDESGCGQRQAPGWRTDENISFETRFAGMMMGELLSRGPVIDVHYVDGETGFTACGLGAIDPADEMSGEWDEVSCDGCLTNLPS